MGLNTGFKAEMETWKLSGNVLETFWKLSGSHFRGVEISAELSKLGDLSKLLMR